ncbi:MAG: hypothetical protein CMB80_19940, partial [Flammeovirgaceae bacterium]|nr:hypothetical protein [Flammeovirgaceae bacterium]
MVSRFQGSDRAKEGGFLAVHKQDFNAHYTGGDFRHTADNIDMNPSLTTFPSPNVQGTLELIAGFAASKGSGFVSVGNVGADGYAVGSYNAGTTTTPTFREAILAAFGDDRLQNGGIVFVLPGTYTLDTTVDVPAGISIMGEISSSIIVGEMTDQPMFKFLRSVDFPRIGGDSGTGELSAAAGSPIDESRLFNIILADNLDGYVGGSGQPDATMLTVPMVQIEASSRVHIENVKFLGRVNNGAVLDRGKTFRAIGYTAGGTTGSYLTVRRCFFDGLKVGIDFSPGNGDIDHLTIDQCRARVFGEEAAVPSSIAENSFVSMSLCNFVATNNFVIGYGTFPTQAVVTCFTVASTGTGGTDVSIRVAGTTGSPSGGPGNAFKSVFENEGGPTGLKAHLAGNNWASDVGARWSITVAAGDLSDSGYADFSGPGAIDLILQAAAATTFEYPVTVIVNSGTYEITESEAFAFNNRYSFVGNMDESSQRPIFDMNLPGTSPTDTLGNRLLSLGVRLENIHFRSSTADTGTTSFHGIRPNISGTFFESNVLVRNCVFENCTLSCQHQDGAGNQRSEHIEIVGCQFTQNASLAAVGVGLLAPKAEYVLLDSCTFKGGYAGLIGEDGSFDPGGAPWQSRIIVRDCVMDMTDAIFTDDSPLAFNSFF